MQNTTESLFYASIATINLNFTNQLSYAVNIIERMQK